MGGGRGRIGGRGGSKDRGAGYRVGSLERLGRKIDFFIENPEKMADNNTVLGL